MWGTDSCSLYHEDSRSLKFLEECPIGRPLREPPPFRLLPRLIAHPREGPELPGVGRRSMRRRQNPGVAHRGFAEPRYEIQSGIILEETKGVTRNGGRK